MNWTGRAKVENGTLVMENRVPLPDGSEVLVSVELLASEAAETGASEDQDFAGFFGMWTGREDMLDSEAWVRRERDKWQERRSRQG